MRIVFIIPLKAEERSKDWPQTCRLLNATLKSIAAQTSSSYHTLLVCNEAPELEEDYANLTVLETDIRIEDPYDFWKGCRDKQRKVLHGLLHCRDINPDTFMIVDADDLVHRDLVKFVCDNADVNAFILNQGYRYNFGNVELRKSKNFHTISASTMIFPYEASDFSEVRSDNDVEVHYATQTAHPKPIEKIFASRDIAYKYVPFYAGIYMRGYDDSLRDDALKDPQSNASTSTNRSTFKRKAGRAIGLIWKVYGRLLGTQRVDATIKRDFAGILVK